MLPPLLTQPTNELGGDTTSELTIWLAMVFVGLGLASALVLILLHLPPPAEWRFNRSADRWEQKGDDRGQG